jgi:hypothetical protein
MAVEGLVPQSRRRPRTVEIHGIGNIAIIALTTAVTVMPVVSAAMPTTAMMTPTRAPVRTALPHTMLPICFTFMLSTRSIDFRLGSAFAFRRKSRQNLFARF